MSFKAGEIFDMARFFLNDTENASYHDDVLLPGLKAALVDLELECEDNNIPFINVTSAVITVPQGATDIGGSSGPALPADLVEVVEIYERTAGTSSPFIQLARRNFLPHWGDSEQGFLNVYAVNGGMITFPPATGPIEVKIDYIGNTFKNVVDGNSLILLNNSKSFLWFRTAAFAANFIGENKTRSDELNAEALRCIETMENIGIKSQQGIPIRRRPFMSGYRRNNSIVG